MSDLVVEKNNEYYRLIKQALEEHKLAFMIGAGVSRATDDRNPSWPDLINILKRALNDCREDDYLKVAQLYYIKYGALNLKNTVQSQFPSKAIPGEFQKSILELNPHYIITTNWDCYFDNLVNEDISYPYDVVANDWELVESKNDNKIIKMHGDFSHGNYVFTEGDYLNYSNNFPLIENYVKSVFSTHAIVMLGYSFNDIDLKQIVTWFQNHSDQQPPIYMVVYNYDEYKQQYLEKFGIKSVVVESTDPTEGLRTFLNTLKSDAEIYASNPSSFVNYKLKGFERLNKVLQSHLLKSLTNCGIDYFPAPNVLLHFYDSFMSSGYDERKRKIYREFVEKFESNEQNNQIVSILLKAGINGIVTSKDNVGINYRLFNVDKKSESIFTFLDNVIREGSNEIIGMVRNVAFLYNRGELERAYEKNEEFLILCKKLHYYEWLLIGIYNREVLLRGLQFNIRTRQRYLAKKPENIERILFILPKDVQRNNLYLRDFLLGKDLNEMFFYVSQVVEKKNEQVYCIENGGACYDADSLKYEHEHQNLIEFVIGNGLCMENDTVYKNLCNKYVEVAFVRKSVQDSFSLNKVELFTCIKYLSTKSLWNYLKIHVFKNKDVKIAFDKQLLDWLIDDALFGLVNLFGSKHDMSIEYDKCILHTLILLSLNDLDGDQTHKIFGLMNALVSNSLNTPKIFQAINTFFANQWHLYQKKYEDQEIIGMLENLLNRFVLNDLNGYEYDAISRHGSSNIFNFTMYLTRRIESINLVKKIVLSISDEKDEKEKIALCESLLLNLYSISSKECQREIKKYLTSIRFKSKDFFTNIKLMNYKIKLIVVGIKKNVKETLKELNKIIDGYNTNVMCSDLNYTSVLFNSLVREQKKIKSKVLAEILSTQQKLKKIVEKSNDMSDWLSVI